MMSTPNTITPDTAESQTMKPPTTSFTSTNGEAPDSKQSTKGTEVANISSSMEKAIEGFNKRLCGGIQGDFYEEGSPLDDKHRHGQLQGLFAIREEMEKVQSKLNSMELHKAQEEAKADKAVPVGSKKLRENVEMIVEKRTEARFRDLVIRCKRLEAELKNEKARNERGVKKGASKEIAKPTNYDAQIDTLSKEIKKTDEEKMKQLCQLKGSIDVFRRNLAELQSDFNRCQFRYNTSATSSAQLQDDMNSATSSVELLRKRATSLESACRQHTVELEHMVSRIQQVEDELENNKRSIAGLEVWSRKMSATFDELADTVTYNANASRNDSDEIHSCLRRLEYR